MYEYMYYSLIHTASKSLQYIQTTNLAGPGCRVVLFLLSVQWALAGLVLRSCQQVPRVPQVRVVPARPVSPAILAVRPRLADRAHQSGPARLKYKTML